MGIEAVYKKERVALLSIGAIRPQGADWGLLLEGYLMCRMSGVFIDSVLGNGKVHIKSAITSAWKAGTLRTSLPISPAACPGAPPLALSPPPAAPDTPPLLHA